MKADIYDALNQNTRATGQWGKGKPPAIPEWPRPKNKSKTEEKKPKVTVADLYKKFNRR